MSDIFNEYAKQAIKQGLIKEASEVSDETNQRFDSLSDDDIRSLYDVKPNGEEKHILDQAHPESVYVAPAYDKMNGLVENLFERQDIMAWVATKPNDGKHTQKRYVKASQDLTMALLNTAFMLDRTGDQELMKLADSCADRLSKQALLPAIPAGVILGAKIVAGIAALMGTSYAVQEFTITQGIIPASELAVEKLTDMLESHPEYSAEFGKLRSAIIVLYNVANKVQRLDLSAAPTSDTDVEGAEEAATKMYDQNAFKILEYYARVVDILNKAVPLYKDILEEKDKESDGWGAFEWARQIGREVYKTDVPDAIKALEDLGQSLMKGHKGITAKRNLLSNFAKNKEDVLRELEKAKEGLDVKENQKQDKTTQEDLESELQELLGEK